MKNLLFGVRGRLPRASFWLVALGVVVVELLLFAALGGEAAMSGDPQAALAAMGLVAGAVLLVFGLLATWSRFPSQPSAFMTATSRAGGC